MLGYVEPLRTMRTGDGRPRGGGEGGGGGGGVDGWAVDWYLRVVCSVCQYVVIFITNFWRLGVIWCCECDV